MLKIYRKYQEISSFMQLVATHTQSFKNVVCGKSRTG